MKELFIEILLGACVTTVVILLAFLLYVFYLMIKNLDK